MSLFGSTFNNRPSKSKFDLSHEVKLTMNFNDLVPIMNQEVLPGDSFRVNTEHMIRLAPMIAPVMHRMNVHVHYFFVPNRLLWNEWEDFITGGRLGNSEPVHPFITFDSVTEPNFFNEGSLADYLGLPTSPVGPQAPYRVSSLPFRAYQLIYNEYYRDQNLEEPIPISLSSGAEINGTPMLTLRQRCWEKDYFTSALPWAQRGGEAALPLGSNAPVVGNLFVKPATSTDRDFSTQIPAPDKVNVMGQTNDPRIGTLGYNNGSEPIGNVLDYSHGLEADLSLASPVSINELRKAFRLQEWLEKSARGGARYIEQILSHFGVRSSDARLQRPEFLGGAQNPIVISEVLNNAGSIEETLLQPLGTMSGHGISIGSASNWSRSFEEHGYIIGIMSIIPKTAYQQGLSRQWVRFDKFDYYWPEFAQLGEQEVKNQELFLDPDIAANRETTFGYQSRYADYKYSQSRVHGEFKSSLDYWHLGRIFNSQPQLNADFVKSSASNRIFAIADQSAAKFYVQLYHNVSAIRPIPYANIPTI